MRYLLTEENTLQVTYDMRYVKAVEGVMLCILRLVLGAHQAKIKHY